MTDDSWVAEVEGALADANDRIRAVEALVDEVKDAHPKDAWIHRDKVKEALGQNTEES